MRTPFHVVRALHFCLAVVAFSLASAVPGSRAYAQMYKGTQLVKADLVADTTAVAPAKIFTVGLRLRMAPHWHTYWQNSGDAGLPTSVEWQLPDGFRAGPLLWPIPTRIDSPGDIVNYGYGEQVVLLTEITPPAQLAPGEITIKAKAAWLVCAELCVPGDANLALKLPTGGEAAPANGPVFAESRALLPHADTDSSVPPLSVERRLDGENLLLNFAVGTPGEGKYGVEFFPVPPDDVGVGHPVTTAATLANGRINASVKLPIPTNPAGADKVSGVLVITSPDGDRIGYAVPSKGVTPATSAPAAQAAAPPRSGGVSGIGQSPGDSANFHAPPAAPGGGTVAKTGNVPVSAGNPGVGDLWHFLFFGLIGGLILNVMPCVLPVISLKIFSFIKQANDAPERVFRLGLAYAAGVFAWFLGFAALVVILKAGGREVGYAFHLQNPWFIVGLSVAVFVFALNLLGVFEFILPGAAAGALSEASQRTDGYSGAFLQGILATVLGSACTAPFFGAALGFAFAQTAPIIFAMFAAIALGMSLPFLLLTAFPAWLRFLPRPGAWMERVKQATGFLMLATLLWLLSILGAMRGADAVVWTGVLLLAIGAACWVQGSFNTLVASARTRGIALAVMLALVAGGGWLGIRQIAAARLPEAADGSAKGFTASLDAALREEGRPVFVDFTAAWCVNCKANERVVLNSESVQRALKEANANFLTADWTNGEAEITKALQKFGRIGVPLYVIYPADRSREPIVLPELLTQQLVLDGLKSAVGSKRLAAASAPLAATE